MIDKPKMKIGIECHIQINSKSKLFSFSKNSYGYNVNKLINHIDLGYPGTLPSINKYIISSAVKLAHIIKGYINNKSFFDRKHYFYPDLPKGYQITQFHKPIANNGFIIIQEKNYQKKVFIDRIQIEEDTGKSFQKNKYHYVDYNRSGIPLIELVTKPNIETPTEAMNFVRTLRDIIRTLKISNGNMEEGSLRTDLNISIKQKQANSSRVEIKNINSIKFIGQAINYEMQRQTYLKKKIFYFSGN